MKLRYQKPAQSPETRRWLHQLLEEQQQLTAIERFVRHRHHWPETRSRYQELLPARAPGPGQQYAFEVDLDRCSGCKACVTACHALNGLDEEESWRSVGLLIRSDANWAHLRDSQTQNDFSRQPHGPLGICQHVTTACHHCIDPGCLKGCPVLAYDKDPLTGIVRHLDDQCMGCGYCIMMCPYEVPAYSPRLGIVRKCDFCSQRLAKGEAPACAQACPHQAIKITLADTTQIEQRYRRPAPSQPEINPGQAPPQTDCAQGNSRFFFISIVRFRRFALRFLEGKMAITKHNHQNLTQIQQISWSKESSLGDNLFLPDSPDPAITVPSTHYRSTKLPGDLVAADQGALRMEPAHWPLILMLLGTQAAAGTALVGAMALSCGYLKEGTALNPWVLLMLGFGLAFSALHLGRPTKAWRAFLGWRQSWLSREIIGFSLFAGISLATAAARLQGALLLSTAALGVAAVFVSAMVYAQTRRPVWRLDRVLIQFLGTTCLLGASAGALAWSWNGFAAGAAWSGSVATAVRTALFIWRHFSRGNARVDLSHPLHASAQLVTTRLGWTITTTAILFCLATGFGLLGIVNFANAATLWSSLAGTATLGSEIVGRYLFFAASGSKRMPGGIPTCIS